MLNETYNFIVAHKAAIAVAVAWFTRELHVCWPVIKGAYPAIVANGGVLRIAGRLIYVPTPKQTPPQTEAQQPK